MSKLIEITYDIAMAASRDAGDQSMREGKRTVWAVKDWNIACETFERLYGVRDAEQRKDAEHERHH